MRSILAFITLVFALGAQAQTTPRAWQLLMPGSYHGDEAPTQPGMGWLALIPVGGVWRLEPAMVRAKRVHDSVLDAEGQKTGIEISSNPVEAMALVRFAGAKAGKVDTPNMRFKDHPRELSIGGEPLKIPFKGQEYTLEVRTSGVYLRKGALITLLPDLAVGGPDSDNSASLLWAGDLDGDGKLDLLMAYAGFNRGGACLYLSGNAGENALLQQTACHGGVGC